MEKLNDTIILRVSKADRERIREKMDELGVMNMSAYIRKMALDGYCVKLDLQDLKELIRLLRICSNNLNQYAKKANETGSIYLADIQDLQVRLDDLWQAAKVLLVRLASKSAAGTTGQHFVNQPYQVFRRKKRLKHNCRIPLVIWIDLFAYFLYTSFIR